MRKAVLKVEQLTQNNRLDILLKHVRDTNSAAERVSGVSGVIEKRE